MYKRLSSIMFPIVTLLFIGSAYWGYQEHQEKNSILIKAENQYQRAFHDLTYHVEQLHQQLGNTLAVNSTSQAFHRKGLVNVWRLTSEAQNEISQLPLTLLPFNEASDFLSRIANFSYKTAVRDLTKQPLSDEEFKTLKSLYQNSEEISNQLNDVRQQVLSNNLRWMDVETALASEQSVIDNVIIDGFQTVDKKVAEYPEINWGPSVNSLFEKRNMKILGGNIVSEDEVRKKAEQFTGADPGSITIVENGKETDYVTYTATVNAGNNQKLQLNYTKKGGHLVWFLNNRELGKPAIDMAKARSSADKFLDKHGFKGTKAITYDQTNTAGIFTYVTEQNGVLIYPEKLSVKVALDNGEPVHLLANDYIQAKRERKLPKPSLSEADARKSLNPELHVRDTQLALIKNELEEEVLCYEFMGQINGSAYRLYINAETGLEESIEELTPYSSRAEAK